MNDCGRLDSAAAAVRYRRAWPDEHEALARLFKPPFPPAPDVRWLVAVRADADEIPLGLAVQIEDDLALLRRGREQSGDNLLFWALLPGHRKGPVRDGLIRHALQDAAERGLGQVGTWALYSPGSSAHSELLARGFEPGDEVIELQAPFENVLARATRIQRALARRGAIPGGVEVCSFTPVLVQRIRAHFNNAGILNFREFDAYLSPDHPQPMRPEDSSAILHRGRLVGAMMVCRRGDQCLVPGRAVADGWRGGWVNALLLEHSARRVQPFGIRSVRFLANAGWHRETARLAERFGGAEVRRFQRLRIDTASWVKFDAPDASTPQPLPSAGEPGLARSLPDLGLRPMDPVDLASVDVVEIALADLRARGRAAAEIGPGGCAGESFGEPDSDLMLPPSDADRAGPGCAAWPPIGWLEIATGDGALRPEAVGQACAVQGDALPQPVARLVRGQLRDMPALSTLAADERAERRSTVRASARATTGPEMHRSARVGPGPNAAPLLLITLGGLGWPTLSRARAAGSMPWLTGLAQQGAAVPLRFAGPLEPAMRWSTLLTGRRPAEHGIGAGRTAGDEPLIGIDRRVPVLWELAAGAGFSALVVGGYGVQGSAGAGVVSISEAFGTPQVVPTAMELGRLLQPPRLAERIADCWLRPEQLPAELIGWLLPNSQESNHRDWGLLNGALPIRLADALVAMLSRQAAALRLLQDVAPNLIVVDYPFAALLALAETEALAAGQPSDKTHTDRVAAEWMRERLLRLLDALLQALLEGLLEPGSERDTECAAAANIMIVGTGAAGGVCDQLDSADRSGLLIGLGPALRARRRIRAATALDLVPTALELLGAARPSELPGRVLWSLLRTQGGRAQGASTAWCDSAGAPAPGIERLVQLPHSDSHRSVDRPTEESAWLRRLLSGELGLGDELGPGDEALASADAALRWDANLAWAAVVDGTPPLASLSSAAVAVSRGSDAVGGELDAVGSGASADRPAEVSADGLGDPLARLERLTREQPQRLDLLLAHWQWLLRSGLVTEARMRASDIAERLPADDELPRHLATLADLVERAPVSIPAPAGQPAPLGVWQGAGLLGDLVTGIVCLRQRRWGEAELSFERILERAPGQPDALRGHARALLGRGRARAAAAAALAAIDHNGADVAALYLLGFALWRLGKHHAARRALQRAADLAPDSIRVRQLLLRLCREGPRLQAALRAQIAWLRDARRGHARDQRTAIDARRTRRHVLHAASRLEWQRAWKSLDDQRQSLTRVSKALPEWLFNVGHSLSPASDPSSIPVPLHQPPGLSSGAMSLLLFSSLSADGCAQLSALFETVGVSVLRDADHPWRWSAIDRLRENPELLRAALLQPLYVPLELLCDLPAVHSYALIFVDRPAPELLLEAARSSVANGLRRLEAEQLSLDEQARLLTKHRNGLVAALSARPNLRLLVLDHAALAAEPQLQRQRIETFIGYGADGVLSGCGAAIGR